jgi:hypothetical protein
MGGFEKFYLSSGSLASMSSFGGTELGTSSRTVGFKKC